MQPMQKNVNLAPADSYVVRRHVMRLGDVVRVRPTTGRRNGFVARIRAIRVNRATGDVVEVEVYGGRPGHEMVRTFRPDRIQRAPRPRDSASQEEDRRLSPGRRRRDAPNERRAGK